MVDYFNRIPQLIEIDVQHPISNLEELLKKGKQIIPDIFLSLENQMDFNSVAADFYISGKIYGIPIFMNSQNALHNLFYINSFFLNKMTKQYYTKQSDWNNYLLCLTLDGAGYLSYGGKHYVLGKGTGCLIDCRQPHYFRTEGEHWDFISLHLDGVLMENYYKRYKENDEILFFMKNYPNFENELIQLIKVSQSLVPYKEYEVSSHITDVLTKLITTSSGPQGNQKKHPKIIHEIIVYIQSNFKHKIRISDISEKFSVSQSYVSHEFKKITGFSLVDYINRYRITVAKQLLFRTDLSVKVIGEEVGFEDNSYFVKRFKHFEQVTPLGYREKVKKSKSYSN